MELSEIRALWQKNDFYPKKSLGQNFLVDKNIREKIIDALSLTNDTALVEIGPGFGEMTLDLAARCRELFAIEKDKRICEIMLPIFRANKNIHLIQADILKLALCDLIQEGERVTVFGNMPYYISSPIIEKIINERECVDALYITMQEELASRIVSKPGSKEYGSITCFIQFYAEVRKLFRIKRNSFYPRPNVDSAFVEMKMRRVPVVRTSNEETMFKIIRKAFSQRRKKLVNVLASGDFLEFSKEAWRDILDSSGIDASKRAEELALTDYASLADNVVKLSER